ncbi:MULTISPECIES: hypothetical protein [unclassified Cupriavidus]|uniref:hypothetical protein n=1 Tax=unclassified Cupriavidus TaxID=2640874 RepID=UPI00313AEBB2
MSRNIQHPSYSRVEINIAVNTTVVFARVEARSELDDRVRDLKTSVEAFSGFVEDGMPSIDLKRMANFVNAHFSSLADAIEKQGGLNLVEVVATAVETAAAIIKHYGVAREATPEFGTGASERLAKRTHELFRNTAGRIINERFMWNLKFYDWASRKRLLNEPRRYERRYNREERPQTFTDEELGAFFGENEQKVLEELVRIAGNQGELVDPLADYSNATAYETFRRLPPLSTQELHSNSKHDE